MDFDIDSINNDAFYLYEKASRSRKSSGYHVFMRCTFRAWKSGFYTEDQKMQLIKLALRGKVMNRLEEANLLPPEFDPITNNLFDIAPYSSSDFKGDMMLVVAYHWENLPQVTREAWQRRARRLNDRPLCGQFQNSLPTLYMGSESSEELHWLILRRDFNAFKYRMEKKINKLRNPKGLHDKVEKVVMKQEVGDKYYFCEQIPYTVMRALFGAKLQKFSDGERMDNNGNSGAVKSFHITTRERMMQLFCCQDMQCAQIWTYNEVEVEHNLCSYGVFEWVDSRQQTTFFGWRKDRRNRLVVRYNNYDNTSISEGVFIMPVWFSDNNTKKYVFENDLSVCGRFWLKHFYPIMISFNMNNLMLKIIASRACETIRPDHPNVFNKSYCSSW